MAAVGGLLGVNGGVNGTGIQGPSSANIQAPVTQAQNTTAYNANQAALAQQNALVNQFQPGGQAATNSQQALLSQLQAGAQGQGPNPNVNQLNQSTGQNVANQNALMAGQRGSSQNVGLMARSAAQQGAATQQNAAGQAATLSAQQQLAQEGMLQNQQQAMIGNQTGATGANTTATNNEWQNTINGINALNNANVGMQSNINSNNASLAGITMQGQQNMLGGMMSGAGSALGSFFADGGEVGSDAPPASEDQPSNNDAKSPQTPEVSSNGSAAATPASGSAPQQANFGVSGNSGGVSTTGPNVAPGGSIPTISNAFQSSGGGGGGGGMSSMLGLLALAANGGEVRMASGGGLAPMGQISSSGPQSSIGQYLSGVSGKTGGVSTSGPNVAAAGSIPTIQNAFAQQSQSPDSSVPNVQGSAGALPGMDGGSTGAINYDTKKSGGQFNDSGNAADYADSNMLMGAKGGKVPALLSPGEKYLPPKAVEKVAKGADPMKVGQHIPGTPKVKGAKNSYANDTVPATLEEGGIVLPRSVTQAKNPHWEAHKFVSAIMAKEGRLPAKSKKAK